MKEGRSTERKKTERDPLDAKVLVTWGKKILLGAKAAQMGFERREPIRCAQSVRGATWCAQKRDALQGQRCASALCSSVET